MYNFKWNSTLFHLNFQPKKKKKLSGKICTDFDIANVKLHL